MDSEKFVYWLQGALEVNPEMLNNGMTPEQVQTIQDHLDLVLKKITPNRFEVDTGACITSTGNYGTCGTSDKVKKLSKKDGVDYMEIFKDDFLEKNKELNQNNNE
jgi:hypothetical protein